MTIDHRETSSPNRPIIVYCPPFHENSGGAIVLHYLVDRLRALGAEAYGWNAYSRDMPSWLRALKTWNRRRKLGKSGIDGVWGTHPSMDVPMAPREILPRAIAVYPEIVSGNPLGARHVVRWLLQRPNSLSFDSDSTLGEEIFFYQRAFAKGIPSARPDNLLQVRWLREDIYSDCGTLPRQGACRMIRKGKRLGLAAVPKGDDAILLDHKSHEEIAEVFKRSEVFYSHDPYTMYCYYAALCGCVPVVLPQPGLTREAWRAGFELKHGVAYGVEEVDWARRTQRQLIADMKAAKAAEAQNLTAFLMRLKVRFG